MIFLIKISVVLFILIFSAKRISSTLYYKEHRIRTEQLCPDLQESLTSKDIDTANYPYKSVFRLYPHLLEWDPCMFESRGPRNQFTTVVIKAVQATQMAWNFSGAAQCEDHIKLRLPGRGQPESFFFKSNRPLCTVRKPANPGGLFQGPFYHPHVWQMTRNKMGISFSVYENSTEETSSLTDNENNEIPNASANILAQARIPKFLQVVFASYFGETCSLRIQQYGFDLQRDYCNGSQAMRAFRLCGVYNCSQEEEILRRTGFWSEDKRASDIQTLINYFKRNKGGRRGSAGDGSVMDFFISIMRLLIMPMVFCVAYYVTRQLREKLASRGRDVSSVGSMTLATSRRAESLRGIAVARGNMSLLSFAVEAPRRYADPPPPYELVTPPSYYEALKKEEEAMRAIGRERAGTSVVGIEGSGRCLGVVSNVGQLAPVYENEVEAMENEERLAGEIGGNVGNEESPSCDGESPEENHNDNANANANENEVPLEVVQATEDIGNENIGECDIIERNDNNFSNV